VVGSLRVFEIYRTGSSMILILFPIPRPQGSLISNVPKHAELVVKKKNIEKPPPPPHCKTHASRTDKLE